MMNRRKRVRNKNKFEENSLAEDVTEPVRDGKSPAVMTFFRLRKLLILPNRLFPIQGDMGAQGMN